MLDKSDTNISQTLATFNQHNIDVALLVPTQTGMEKSIMDATATLRSFFKENQFHDYETQEKGPDAKVVKQIFYVRPNTLEPAFVSLYRPQTKSGDPRVWFSHLKKYAWPHNLLAIIIKEDKAYVVNCSDTQIMASLSTPTTPLGTLSIAAKPSSQNAATELLKMIGHVSNKGFIQTKRSGATGVGMTLETMLGISANSSKAPDYKGIEIKAKREKKGRSNRSTLFSKAPNWHLSPIGNAWSLLSTYGYHRDGKLRLNQEINAKNPNSLGWGLELDTGRDWLKGTHTDSTTSTIKHLTTWEMNVLRSDLKAKHKETFWVTAKCRGKGMDEEFHYIQIEHTREPKVRNLNTLIETGVISVDFLMSQKGPQSVRDHGYLFKIHQRDFPALFPPSQIYNL
jgi:hypothetical protein